MLCRPDGGPSGRTRASRQWQQARPAGGPPLEVVAFLGDNILDFPNLTQAAAKKADTALDAFGVTYFMLPNPMYGSWQ